MTTTQPPQKFRSVLPHEPLPVEEFGYLHIQGSFQPRQKDKSKQKHVDAKNTMDAPDTIHEEEWTIEMLRDALQTFFIAHEISVCHLELLDLVPPFTKIRLQFPSPNMAQQVMYTWKSQKLSPMLLFSHDKQNNFSGRPLQMTQITKCPLCESSWPRSNPPKFKRLLQTNQDATASRKTRFLYMDGLLSNTTNLKHIPHYEMVQAIRQVMNVYDTSGLGVEVYCSKRNFVTHCHVGMRSNQDVTTAIQSLQGQVVEWNIISKDKANVQIKSEKLFLDYAMAVLPKHLESKTTSGPPRSTCTSTTNHIVVPGLLLKENYITKAQEDVLMAALVGPHAPWAPHQSTMSFENNMVKRRVQHYGYVFDYQTADVLRDLSQPNANCPPMPGLCHEDKSRDLQVSIEESTRQGKGWDALAGIIEQTRRVSFDVGEEKTGNKSVCFPDLNQMTVNEYKPGQGIGSHVDTKTAFGDGLLSLSLKGGVVMEFRQAHSPNQTKLVYLPPRSLLIMSGPARYEWEHMIVTRSTDTHEGVVLPRTLRVSLTLRTALQEPIQNVPAKPLPRVESNVFPPKWGSHLNNGDAPREEIWSTPDTEKHHVHHVYDSIATQWHHTRGKRGVLWPGATQFLTNVPRGSLVADVGCGDGKYFPAIWQAGSYVIGTDISRPLLLQAAASQTSTHIPDSRRVGWEKEHLSRKVAVAVGDCMSVPLRTNSCDAAICIAVMHHLSTVQRRIRCIQELVRIVHKGGTINIQAWAMQQDESSRRKFASTDVFVPFNAQPRYLDKVNTASTETSLQEEVAPESKSVAQMYSEAYRGAEFDENKGLVVFQRYCHLYKKGELEELAQQVEGTQVMETGYESGNYFIIIKVVE